VTSVAANGASMATRVPLEALAPLLANTSVIAAVRAYLGPDALLDGYKAVRLAPTASEAENIAGLWHNDRAGNRLKLFVRLHDVDPRPEAGGHPTLVARGSHGLLQWSVEGYEHSRYHDAMVRSEFTVAAIGGGAGSGFIFDTNTIHRAVPEGRLGRTVIVLEFHAAAKCPVVQQLDLPIPCPSGDQRLLSLLEKQLAATEPNLAPRAAAAGADAEGDAPPSGGNACTRWLALPDGETAASAGSPVRVARRGAAPLGEWATGPSEDSLVVWTPASSPELSLLALGEVPGTSARALGVAEGCRWAWRHYSFDVMPMDGNTAWFDGAAGQGRAGVCLLDGQLGRVPFDGEYAGGCVLPGAAATAFGGFDMLLALPPAAADAANAAANAAAVGAADAAIAATAADAASFRALVGAHLTAADAATLQSVTGVPLAALLDAVVAAGAAPVDSLSRPPLLEALLTPARFLPHALNAQGLHLLRVLLAERMGDARRAAQSSSAEAAALREAWVRDGYLRLDFARYVSSAGDATHFVGNERLNEVLRMASASELPQHAVRFVEREVTHMGPADPQCALHLDTFHSVVKLWVYGANVSVAHGPLHVVRGSHRSSAAKLAWLFSRTRANSAAVIKEPSIRFDERESAGVHAAEALEAAGLPHATPVLPLPGVARTLVVADTSGLHCRGLATPGLSRRALRPMGADNDGGVKRSNPFRRSSS